MPIENELHALIERYRQEMIVQYPPQSSASPPTIQVQPPAASEISDERTDIGQLQVRVSTENEAVPLPRAVITITDQANGQRDLIRTVITDESGMTPLMELPAKDRQLTLEPGNPDPYAVYTVDVSANGYFPKRFINLPIYGGVTAIQNVSMIPLPEFGDQDLVLSYPQGGPTL